MGGLYFVGSFTIRFYKEGLIVVKSGSDKWVCGVNESEVFGQFK